MKTDRGILQGHVARHLKCSEAFDNHFIADLVLSVTVKEFLEICQYLIKVTKKNRRLTFWIDRSVFFLAHPVVMYCSSNSSSSRANKSEIF